MARIKKKYNLKNLIRILKRIKKQQRRQHIDILNWFVNFDRILRREE